jgi:DNA-binding MarR family transcriptional regulator
MDDETTVDDSRLTAYGHLVEAHALLARELDRELVGEIGLPLMWYGVLLHLGRVPGEQRPISELVNATAFTSGGVTRLVDRMERAGLVDRRPCLHDRRVTYVGLTEAGREMLARATIVHLCGLQRHLVDVLGDGGLSRLDCGLQAILMAAGKME